MCSADTTDALAHQVQNLVLLLEQQSKKKKAFWGDFDKKQVYTLHK